MYLLACQVSVTVGDVFVVVFCETSFERLSTSLFVDSQRSESVLF